MEGTGWGCGGVEGGGGKECLLCPIRLILSQGVGFKSGVSHAHPMDS